MTFRTMSTTAGEPRNVTGRGGSPRDADKRTATDDTGFAAVVETLLNIDPECIALASADRNAARALAISKAGAQFTVDEPAPVTASVQLVRKQERDDAIHAPHRI
jgi:hypothetical protein